MACYRHLSTDLYSKRGNEAGLGSPGEELEVRIDQDLCTGDGLCAQYAPEVFELDIDGLAYVKDGDGRLRTEPGAAVGVPTECLRDVLDAAHECPGDCIFVQPSGSGTAHPAA
jgi:ferredoxin